MDDGQMEIGTAVVERDNGRRDVVAEGVDEGNELIRLALDKGADVEVLERLVALQERVADRRAEMAMAQALADFQAECPPIRRVATADVRKNGVKQYEYTFAPYDEVSRTIRPHLAKHGLSYTHDSVIVGSEVEVTCTLRHVDGATRTATFRGPFDNSGGKNALQAVGSSRSYGKRYTLTDVTGISTEDDDDGRAAGGKPNAASSPINRAQLKRMNDLADKVGADKRAFAKWLGVESLADVTADRYAAAITALEEKGKEKEGEAAK